jgi:hypothetical protein
MNPSALLSGFHRESPAIDKGDRQCGDNVPVDALQAEHIDRIGIRRDAGTVERVGSAAFAEIMFRRTGIELVQRQRFRALQQPEPVGGHAMHDRIAAAADRTVADRDTVQIRIDLENDVPAVATTPIGFHRNNAPGQ